MTTDNGHRRRQMAPVTRAENMRRIKGSDTRPELMLRRALWQSGARYRLRLKLPGTPDISFPQVRIAVFVDGCFWHDCPLHGRRPGQRADYWREKFERNVARDRRVNEELLTLGWRVIRVWEHDVRQNVEGVAAKILRLVQSAEPFCDDIAPRNLYLTL